MKFKVSIIILVFLSVISCKEATETNKKAKSDKKTETLAEDVKNISLDIGGMTCEIGCAKLIESKLAKTEGVKSAKVIFTDSVGKVTFDKNQISKEEIVQTIEKIADGSLYKVKKVIETE